MRTTLRTDITVKAICDGFVYNELEGKGLFGLSGKLTIQPERFFLIAQHRCFWPVFGASICAIDVFTENNRFFGLNFFEKLINYVEFIFCNSV